MTDKGDDPRQMKADKQAATEAKRAEAKNVEAWPCIVAAYAGQPALSLHGLRRSFGTLAEWVACPADVSE